ncbi:MAG: BON domain-containing protein [Planctomycetaceae bacterium]
MVSQTQTPSFAESDAELRQLVISKLRQRGIPSSVRLSIDIENGVVRVAGEVQSYYQRQLIINSIRQVTAVSRIQDEIEVEIPEEQHDRFLSPALLATRAPEANAQRMNRFRSAVVVAAVAVLMASCSKAPTTSVPVYPVKGKLTFEGEPTPGAFIVLHPVGHELPKDATPKARVSPDGTFKIGTFSNGDGAPEGEYILTAEWKKLVTKDGDTLPGPNVIPNEYSDAKTSQLRVKVAKGDNEWEPLQISSAADPAEGSAQ